jgi:hypothetical protein
LKTLYRPNAALPTLAWLARLDWGSREVWVEHGSAVETRQEFFFEGAWAGDFQAGRPDLTEVVFGSGCVMGKEQVFLISSLATTDYLYFSIAAGVLSASNSLALLLAGIGDALDPRFTRYDEINNTILKGVVDYARDIPTRGGRVRRLMHHNLECTPDGVTEISKPESPVFSSFEDYQRYLATSYELLARNARDSRRAHPLRIYSTQSRGYDTTAINAIAARHGLDGVFTVTHGKGKPGEPDVNDDGTEIARLLGIGPVIPLNRHGYQEHFEDELYYHASISECQDANLEQVADHIQGPALLLTGTLGEMWYTHRCGYVNRPGTLHGGLARWDLGCHGLTEVRLRSGYVQGAIPYIGARRREQILRITESEAMGPWRLNNSYDRPIPRRLGEEAGVPRAAFGQLKIGSVVEWAPPQIPRDARLRRKYLQFLGEAGLRSRWQLRFLSMVQRLNGKVATMWSRYYRIVYYPERAAWKLLRWRLEPPVFWRDLRGSLFCFAVNECVQEYRTVLRPEP